MTKRDKGTLAAKRAEIIAAYARVKSWRKLAEQEYPKVRPGTLCAIAGGYEPKSRKVLDALGLPVLQPTPVCPTCGIVHVKACPKRRQAARLDYDGWRQENQSRLQAIVDWATERLDLTR